MAWMYILRCSDESLYVGCTTDLGTRLRRHAEGEGGSYTAKRLPITLVYSEEFLKINNALTRERQIKRWSAQKKRALISGDFRHLKALARRRRSKKV